ncbi:MAG: alpha/beta hydrolase [Myxococcota bacterium]|nr:alpha/beta hydrolase [Myxococcota bacterium]
MNRFDVKTKYASMLAVVLLGIGAAGCLAKTPCRTIRPHLETTPFKELRVRSAASGHTYQYLFAPGPSPEAPAMLLLHGGIFDSRIWLNAAGLAQRFNLYALQWPDNSLYYTGRFSDYGAIARDFLNALGIDQVYVAGVSMGVTAAIELALRPDAPRIEALILISGILAGISEEEIAGRTDMAKLALGFSPARLRAIVNWRSLRTDYDPAPGPYQMIDIFYTRPYPYYYQVFSAALNQGATRQATQKINAPVLFLNGTADDIMLIHAARLNPTVFKDADMVEFEGYKHAMVFTQGSEIVQAILKYLDQRGL